MNWLKEKPTVPGYYWCRLNDEDTEPEIILVREDEPLNHLDYFECGNEVDISNQLNGLEWQGPIKTLGQLNITLNRRGSRDLYWCWIVNEPMIISYSDPPPLPKCPHCQWEDTSSPDPNKGLVSEDFLSYHTFMFGVLKPFPK